MYVSLWGFIFVLMLLFSDRSAPGQFLTSETQYAKTTRPQRSDNHSQTG